MTTALLIDEQPIQVLPTLAREVGFMEAAILQEIHYCLQSRLHAHFKEGRYWIPNVSNQLCQRFFFWEADDILYMVAQLEQLGILSASQEHPSSKVRYYAINYELLNTKEPTPIKLVPIKPFMEEIPSAANENMNTKPSFRTEVHRKGPHLYAMIAEDPRHFLACEVTLEIHENKIELGEGWEEVESIEVFCHFPRINDEQLKEFVWQDAALYSMLMAMFQMQLMEHLLLFCATHHATNLVIFAEGTQAEKLEIYWDFLALHHLTPTTEEKTEIAIPANRKTFDKWVDFMYDTVIRIRQDLWEEQKRNPVVQHYLKSQDLPGFI